MSNNLKLDTSSAHREFRVKSVRRFVVTDWESDGVGRAGVSQIAECDSVEKANTIARTFGRAHPGSLINEMDPKAIAAWDGAACQLALDSDQVARLDNLLAGHGGLLGHPMQLSPEERIDGGLKAMPYDLAKMIRQVSRLSGAEHLAERLDRLQIAVDA